MVTQVYGSLQGQRIKFDRTIRGGEWIFAAPCLDTGEYIMDIYADDDAGNTAYMATMLWAVTTDNLCVNVRMVRMSGVARDSGVLGVPRMQRYRAQTGEPVFYGIPKMTKYSASVVRCELCGRW